MAMESESGERLFMRHAIAHGMASNPLDNPVWHALLGPHRQHAIGRGLARHYPRDIAPFSAIAEATDEAYADLAAHLPPRTEARLFRPCDEALPAGWEQLDAFPMLQMVALNMPPKMDQHPAVMLSEADVPAMLELVAVARPGPFGARTRLLGAYIGVREGDRLVAIAGERLRLAGYVELSAICVHPEARGRGHAAALASALMRAAFERGEMPFLHVRSDNAAAVRLYEKLGFTARRQLTVLWRRPS